MKPVAPPSLKNWTQGELARSAESELTAARHEIHDASALSERAFARAWAVGRCCVELKNRIGPDRWEAFAKKHFGSYFPVYRCMRLARMNPDAPPLRGSGRFKELLIMSGRERPPKTTPKRELDNALLGFRQLAARVRRWWRGGDVVDELSPAAMASVAATAAELESIAADLRA